MLLFIPLLLLILLLLLFDLYMTLATYVKPGANLFYSSNSIVKQSNFA